ncbi:bromodomain-containing protein 4 isoform X2 [Brachypodium distachyon]|uniref:Uncharacterized protein n=1 Tax=Brachypodium distachyon TaxID=15368 RepID=A0A0Q3HHQ1_BRADI|nr:bromodomain-containing protein 4 isoform X2 [Brachypodium distachyon]KQJ92986.1 hypothetical protein BRADI_3g02060v3 [Brachypodium distachyon]|eukprot:XP_010233736.1 bromodomain-containing protein 4 isoform X2 [Brachypodium distachyon]
MAEEEFDEGEMEVAAILVDLPSLVLARAGLRRRRQQKSPPPRLEMEILSWGRRRPRTAHPEPAATAEEEEEEKPAAVVAAAVADSAAGEDRGAGAASPDTPLAFPEHTDEEGAPAEETKELAHKKWVQQQRGVVASLSSENAHLSKQIEQFKARLLASKSTNDSLKQLQQQQQQTKHKKRDRPEEEEEAARKQKRAAAGERPALGLDLNEPAAAEEAEDGKPQPQWRHRGQQELLQKAALSAAARRRRQDIRRAKAAAGGRARGRRG